VGGQAVGRAAGLALLNGPDSVAAQESSPSPRCLVNFRLDSLFDRAVSPPCGAGLLRCASSRCQRRSVSPLTGGHP
jgi:hypothetical protein